MELWVLLFILSKIERKRNFFLIFLFVLGRLQSRKVLCIERFEGKQFFLKDLGKMVICCREGSRCGEVVNSVYRKGNFRLLQFKLGKKVMGKVEEQVSRGRQGVNFEGFCSFCKLWNVMVDFMISFAFLENLFQGQCGRWIRKGQIIGEELQLSNGNNLGKR